MFQNPVANLRAGIVAVATTFPLTLTGPKCAFEHLQIQNFLGEGPQTTCNPLPSNLDLRLGSIESEKHFLMSFNFYADLRKELFLKAQRSHDNDFFVIVCDFVSSTMGVSHSGRDEIPVFLIFDMVVQNKKSGISSLYLAREGVPYTSLI